VRRATKLALGLIALTLLALLALGALPQFLGGGDVYVITAEEVEDDPDAADGDALSSQQYPYVTTALEDGVSEEYEDDRFGIKEWFTHTPFDEMSALAGQVPDAVDDEGRIAVESDGTTYRVELTRVDDA